MSIIWIYLAASVSIGLELSQKFKVRILVPAVVIAAIVIIFIDWSLVASAWQIAIHVTSSLVTMMFSYFFFLLALGPFGSTEQAHRSTLKSS